jgi:hypothetical protein
MGPFKVTVFASLALLAGLSIPRVEAQQQQPPTQRAYTFPPTITQYPNVSQTLNLTPAQTRQLSEMNTKLQADWRDRFNKAWTSTNRDATLQQLQSQYNEAWMKGSRDILNNNQMTRYNQLYLQSQGPGAYFNPDVQKRLNLNEEQMNQLRQLRTQYDRQYQDFRAVDPTRRDDAMKRWETLQKDTSDRIRTILNEQQQKTWSEMTGENFRFAPPFTTTTPPRP